MTLCIIYNRLHVILATALMYVNTQNGNLTFSIDPLTGKFPYFHACSKMSAQFSDFVDVDESGSAEEGPDRAGGPAYQGGMPQSAVFSFRAGPPRESSSSQGAHVTSMQRQSNRACLFLFLADPPGSWRNANTWHRLSHFASLLIRALVRKRASLSQVSPAEMSTNWLSMARGHLQVH